jgi:hypothetical protein
MHNKQDETTTNRHSYQMIKFHSDYHVNQLLISGDWKQVYNNETYIANEILALIVDYYMSWMKTLPKLFA